MTWLRLFFLSAASLSIVSFPGCAELIEVYHPPDLAREEVAIVRAPGSVRILAVDDGRIESVLIPDKSPSRGIPQVRIIDEVQVLPGSHSYKFSHWNICEDCPAFFGRISFPVEANHEYEIRVASGLDRSPQISVRVVDLDSDEKVPFEWLDRSHSDINPIEPMSGGVPYIGFPSGSIKFF
jgi:hypothetical protein